MSPPARNGGSPPALDLSRYWALTRRVSVSLVYVAPLLLAYELALRLVEPSVQNAVEASMKRLLWYLGPGAMYFHGFLLVIVGAAIVRVVHQNLPVFRIFPAFLVESALLAVLLGPLVSWLAEAVPMAARLTQAVPRTLTEGILSSVGAGLYEEFLFRLVLLGGFYLVLRRVLRCPSGLAFALAMVTSAAAFASYHHVGPFGEPWVLQTFLFRFAAGLLLGAVFALRGLGVVVYLHAIYDVLLDLKTAGWPGFGA